MSTFDFLSPFEELVLTALLEAGQGSDELKVWSHAKRIAGRDIRFIRIAVALKMLEAERCVYSWPGAAANLEEKHRPRFYRVQFRGQRALEAATERRGHLFVRYYFHQAARFGLLSDVVLSYRSRSSQENRARRNAVRRLEEKKKSRSMVIAGFQPTKRLREVPLIQRVKSSLRLLCGALSALALTWGYYIFGFTLGGGLLYQSWHLGNSTGFNYRIAGTLCKFIGVLILGLWMPLRRRYIPAGPRLEAQEQPKLFERIYQVACSLDKRCLTRFI